MYDRVECTSNSGFEDQLTEDSTYKVLAYQNNSIQIENDKGQVRWYGKIHFDV
jgi:hypothetical protein